MANRWFRQILGFAVIACTAAPVLAQDCSDAGAVLIEAETKYDTDLPEALVILKACQEARWPGWAKDDRVKALRLMVMAYYVTNEPELARATVTDLLKADSGYDLGGDDPSFFREMVAQEKSVRKARRIINLTIGGVVTIIIGGVGGYLLFRPKDPKSLPTPNIPLPRSQ